MAGQNKRESQRVPVALRIKLRFRKVDTFVSKFATNISTRGMFISSRKPKPHGTQLRFELRLADDSTVIAGRGVVTWVREYDPQHPKEPHGMGIEFIGLNKESTELIGRMVAVRLEQGLGDEGIPFAIKPSGTAKASAVAAPIAAPAEHDFLSAEVDMAAVLRRARSLAGDEDPGSELARLARVSAAPVAQSVDVASNELARMLGGLAVVARHDESSDEPTDYSALEEDPAPEEAEEAEVLPNLEDETEAFSIVEDDRTSRPEPDPLASALESLDEGTVDTDIGEPGLELIEESTEEPIADGSFLDDEEPTRVGEALPPLEDAIVHNAAPYGRAETQVQDPNLYDELAAEQEIYAAPVEGTDDQNDSVVSAPRASGDDSPNGRAATEDIDEFDVLEDIDLDAAKTSDFAALEAEEAPASELDETLASFADASVDIDID